MDTTPASDSNPLVSRERALPRLYQQVAVSALGTVFYTPGGAAGWALDLILRGYLAYVRRMMAVRAARAALGRARRVARA